jgi:hypothetical protein
MTKHTKDSTQARLAGVVPIAITGFIEALSSRISISVGNIDREVQNFRDTQNRILPRRGEARVF